MFKLCKFREKYKENKLTNLKITLGLKKLLDTHSKEIKITSGALAELIVRQYFRAKIQEIRSKAS